MAQLINNLYITLCIYQMKNHDNHMKINIVQLTQLLILKSVKIMTIIVLIITL